MSDATFTSIDRADWIAENDLAFAVRDRFPVSRGHTLVRPKSDVVDWFSASDRERAAILELVDRVKALLEREFRPHGYTIAMDCGEAAGQIVPHLHVHVIPRFYGDVPYPRSGNRPEVPWSDTHRQPPLSKGGDDPFLKHLNPLFATATQIDILAAFVQDSGIALIESRLVSAIERDAKVRILCSDYLHITQEAAVRRLYDLQSASENRIQVRIAASWETSFHPKSWQFVTPEGGSLFVGSSNLSRAALNEGVEWNLRVDRRVDPVAYDVARDAYERTWTNARALTREFVEHYRQRLTSEALDLPVAEVVEDSPQLAPEPHAIQLRVLAGLAQAREEGHRRALAVMATGLGKTWLAAFDVRQFAPDFTPRVLFVVHRAEILTQAANTFRTLYPDAAFSWLVGDQTSLGGDFVFASIQKLARAENLNRLESQHFDYVIIDEVHHATANTYQQLLRVLDPGFLLGLTATPDRADGGDVVGLFNDYVVDEVGIPEGISIGRLVPFAYTGIADTVDYAPIPWRAGRFEPERLARAVETTARMEQVWSVMGHNPRLKTIAFCCTIQHAIFVRDWFTQHGLKTAAVVSGAESDDRDASLRALANGELDLVAAVDILNEGVDIPGVDRVVFLRPTESKVVFLQQLGRGLRAAPGKTHLEVLDFVGNHAIFAERMQWLITLEESKASLQQLIDEGCVDLPQGCSVKLEFEAKEILERLTKNREKDPVVRAYRRFKSVYSVRPTATVLFREGHNFNTLKSQGGWAGLVHQEADSGLTDHVFEQVRGWFEELEKTSMTKSFKMVCLLALSEEGALFDGLSHDTLAGRALRIIRRSPELVEDIHDVAMLGPLEDLSPHTWLEYWRKNPLRAWANSKFVKVDGARFEILWSEAARDHKEAVAELTAELVEYRLAKYKARKRSMFFARVSHNTTQPILLLPSDHPLGEHSVQLEKGLEWVFRFAKIAVNVAHPVGDHKNRLPDLLHAWFGAKAGENGTRHRVRFEKSQGRWFARPVGVLEQSASPNDDEVVGPYLAALKDHVEFHRKIISAMFTFRSASSQDVESYLAHLPAAAQSRGSEA
ncbi:MAG: DEAD/DEAH box helicase family protein [bacterium]